MSTALLQAEAVVKSYDDGRVKALAGVDLQVARGEFLAIIGPSGSGKSTLLHMLGALDRPDTGRVLLDGIDLGRERHLDRVRARQIGFVFQLHNLMPTLTARENVELPLVALRVRAAERRRRAAGMLERVGLGDRLGHTPSELSGGQRQRVAVARALVNEPDIVLADEPTGDLDQESGRSILDLLLHLGKDRGLTLVMVTHNLQLAERAGRIVRMLDGRLHQGA